MKWRKFFFWSACGFLLLLVIAGTWLWTADLGVFKPQLERWVSEQTGRNFVINGEFDVRLGRQSLVIANDVHLANASWADEPDMLEVGHLEVRLNTWSLLKGPIEIDLVEVRDASVLLEKSANLQPNWALLPESALANESKEPAGTGPGWLVRKINVERTRIVYTSPERAGPIDLRIDKLTQSLGPDNFLELNLQAGIADRDLRLQASVGTWDALMAQQNIKYELHVQADKFNFESNGFVDDLVEPLRPLVNFTITEPDINDLARLLQVEGEFIGAINLSGELAPSSNGPLVLKVDGNLGQLNVHAAGSFSDLQNLEDVQLKLVAGGPDLSKVARLFGINQLQPAPFEIDFDAERKGQEFVISKGRMLFADAQFDLAVRMPNFPTLDASEVQFRIAGADFEHLRNATKMPGAATGPYTLEFDLKAGSDGAEIVRMDINSSLLKMSAQGKLGDAPDYLGSELNFNLGIDNLAEIAEAYGIANLPERPAEISGAAQLMSEGIRTRGVVKITSNDITAGIDGLIVLAPGAKGSDLAFTLSGQNLAALINEFVSSTDVPQQPYKLGGRLQVRSNEIGLKGLSGSIGRSEFNVDGRLKQGDGFAGTTFKFKSTGPALEEMMTGIEALDLPPGPYAVAGNLLFGAHNIRLDEFVFSRDRGELSGNLELMLPVSRAQAKYDIRARGDDLSSVLGTIYGFTPKAARFSLDARGALAGTTVSLDNVGLTVGEAKLAASGDLDFGKQTRSTRFAVNIAIPSMANLGLWNGRRLREQSLAMKASVKGADGRLKIDDLNIQLGDSNVRGSVQFENTEMPRFNISLRSNLVRIVPFLEEDEQKPNPQPKFDDGRFIPDFAIPFAQMEKLDAVIKINFDMFEYGNLQLKNLSLETDLNDGELYLHRLGFNAPSGWLEARGSLLPADGAGKAALEMVLRDFALGLSPTNADLSAKGQLELNLQSSGSDLRTLAANLNGVIFGELSGLHMTSSRLLKRFYGDMLSEIIAVVNPFAKSDDSLYLDCVVVPLDIRNGSLTAQPNVLIRTDKVRIAATSTIDLATEKLDLQFRTTPRKGITISAGEIFNPYVKVVGTLANPKLAMDQQGMLVSGGAAVATGGLSILAKATWDRLSRSEDVCKVTEDEARKVLGSRFPELAPPASN